MFEKALQSKLQSIFRMDNVRFSVTSKEVNEQGVLYIDVDEALTRFTPKKAHTKVIGSIYMFAPNNKMKFGFFETLLRHAKVEDKKDLFFTGFDQTKEYQGDLVERRTDFVYLFTQQYDPDGGGIMKQALVGATQQELDAAYNEELEEEEEEPIDDDPTDDEGA